MFVRLWLQPVQPGQNVMLSKNHDNKYWSSSIFSRSGIINMKRKNVEVSSTIYFECDCTLLPTLNNHEGFSKHSRWIIKTHNSLRVLRLLWLQRIRAPITFLYPYLDVDKVQNAIENYASTMRAVLYTVNFFMWPYFSKFLLHDYCCSYFIFLFVK